MVIVIIVVIVTIALFRVALNQQRRLISRALRSRRQAERREEQYYYEMDLRLDASMDPTGTGEQSGPTLPELLLAGQFAHAVADPPWFTSGYPERERYPVVDWSKEHAPRRSWYRVNRMGVDQALHKVYVLAHVYWPDTKKAKPAHSSRNPLRLHLVYEILFHSPSEEPTYLLHTFRAVADASQFLSRGQLDGLKRLVVWKFVNPWITDTHQQVSLDGDALFSLSGKLKRQRGE